VTVWTIDAEPGIDGLRIALDLAEQVGVPVIEGQLVVGAALAVDTTVADVLDLERAAAGRLRRFALALGMSTRAAPELARELQRIKDGKAALERAAKAAAREPCVIVGRCAFVTLRQHPGAVHVRIRAPRDWRAGRRAAEGCVSLHEARRAIAREDRARRAAMRRVHGQAADDVSAFHLVCDASRVPHASIVELLASLAPGRRPVQLARIRGDA